MGSEEGRERWRDRGNRESDTEEDPLSSHPAASFQRQLPDTANLTRVLRQRAWPTTRD
jgi:hypothetical protein